MEVYPLLNPAGLDTQIQINDGGIFGASTHLTLNKTSGVTTATGLTVTGCAVLGLNSAVFQPLADSTTFFQVLDADGGTPILNVDSTNERVEVGLTGGDTRWKLLVAGSISAIKDVDYTGIEAGESATKTGGLYWRNGDAGSERLEFATYNNEYPVSFGQSWVRFNITGDVDIGYLSTPSIRLAVREDNNSVDNPNPLSVLRILRVGKSGNSYDPCLDFQLTKYENSGFAARTRVDWRVQHGSSNTPDTTILTAQSNQFFGFGDERAPETLLELTHATPTITTHGDTHSDLADATAGIWVGKREQSGGEETATAQIAMSHDGTGDDQLGKIVESVNTGAGLAVVMTKDSTLAVSTVKNKITPIGGIAVKLTNKTGSASAAGQLVKADTATNDAVILSAADELETFGVFLDSGIADAAEAWVVISGIADVAMEDNTAATRGNWVRASITEAGYADATNAAAPNPINQTHFAEIGHCIETVTAGGAGTHILARCILHFN